MHTHTIAVLVHSPYDITRTGLASIIHADPECHAVGAASAVEQAATAVACMKPAVIVLDLRQPTDELTELISSVRRRTESRIVGLTETTDWPAVMAFMNAGVSGFLTEAATGQEIVDVVKRVAAGADYVSPQLRLGFEGPNAEDEGPLTGRERQIVSLVAMGYTGEEIGQQLCISPKTVETHRARIARKLGTRSRAQLVRYALDHGLTAAAWGTRAGTAQATRESPEDQDEP